jgi:dUTP pyrophosphatase
VSEDLTLEPGERLMVPTGLAMAIPKGYEGCVRPRSGWAWKHGLTVLNSPGTIDSDYRGEIKVILYNTGKEPILIANGERIAQLVVQVVPQIMVSVVSELDETTRGEGGFGSTGTT